MTRNLFKKKKYKQLEFDFSEKKKEVPVRKPGAVPPKTPTIQKFKNGGAPVKPEKKPLMRDWRGCCMSMKMDLNQSIMTIQ